MSNKINITQQRVITNKDNTFFTNNKITVGSQIPTNGLYEKGDLIVNIGTNNLKEPMWVCVKSGEPGTWEVVGNGSNSGGSNTRMVSLTNNVTISSPTNVVNIGISFNKSTDSLLVFKNGVNVVENIDFTISDDNTQIVNLQGNWNEESLSDYTFTFIVFKNVYVTSDEELSQPDLSDYQQKTDNNLQTSSKELVGAINEINQKANKEVDLSPYQQKTDNNLQTSSKNLVGAINEINQKANEVDLSNYQQKTDNNLQTSSKELVGAINEINQKANEEVDLSPYQQKTDTKLQTSSKNLVGAINEVNQKANKEVDLSPYQQKTDNSLQTSSKNLVGAINEVNQKANKEVDLSPYQQKTDTKLQTSSKELVGAINELFQNANNGKELIASAIGEPLDASDTFSAMSNDINGLLSTFKTNMMKNGVTVEGGDKFKQLIDKIATLADSEGRGIQYASGGAYASNSKYFTVAVNNSTSSSYYIEIPNLNFTPLFIIACSKGPSTNTDYMSILENTGYQSFSPTIKACKIAVNANGTTGHNIYTYKADSNVYDNTSIYLPVISNASGAYMYWYAIGVGEEDTTLRDSLAGILGDKGIEVSPDDDMASLISKVSLFDDYTPSPLYIVNNGVVNTDFKIIKQSPGYSMTQNSDHILFNLPKGTRNNSIAISTSTKFNLTNYANIVIRYYASGARFDLGINTTQSNSNYNNYVHWLGENQVNQETTYRFNISNYNDEYYIIIDVDNLSPSLTSTLKIYDIYLEK